MPPFQGGHREFESHQSLQRSTNTQRFRCYTKEFSFLFTQIPYGGVSRVLFCQSSPVDYYGVDFGSYAYQVTSGGDFDGSNWDIGSSYGRIPIPLRTSSTESVTAVCIEWIRMVASTSTVMVLTSFPTGALRTYLAIVVKMDGELHHLVALEVQVITMYMIPTDNKFIPIILTYIQRRKYGELVKRLRHGSFTAVTWVRLPYSSPNAGIAQSVEHEICNFEVLSSSLCVSSKKDILDSLLLSRIFNSLRTSTTTTTLRTTLVRVVSSTITIGILAIPTEFFIFYRHMHHKFMMSCCSSAGRAINF